MITRDQIPAVLGHPVFDAEGKKIGEAGHVFLDDDTGQPEWVTVKTGMFGSNETFIPIAEAKVSEDHLEVPYPKHKVKDAPNVDVDAGGHLSAQEEHRLYDYYGLAWDSAWRDANQPGEGGWARSGGEAGAAGTAAAAAGAAGTKAGGTSRTGGEADLGKPAKAAGTAGAAGTSGAKATADAAHEDLTMTRFEEHMQVGVERREVGRARLRKFVVTEEEQKTIPVHHQEVRIEREPITDANRAEAMRADMTEEQQEVTLYADRPVIETHMEPVERVRLTTEDHVEQETVRGTVRKERIEAELPEEQRAPGMRRDTGKQGDRGRGTR
ncbi:PRC and DUF2382 domain-containing protein [Yinghuangia sp. ASG 101]|uniref:PRC and DUF2382 domain-containing protein n=1 Tax=Yinghuangia sp. ASG 101 TaxID=2896848 RepID=UPI001E498859|nr:PRC and DUF2382 domain-containing protein [Yinghuangia sp. ASG 101]UGQ10186.1 PRC and DUF2382 domain-containing protein [Yinghuangia sp. ASG 101]